MTRLNYYAIAITWKTYGEMEHGTHNSYPPTQLLKPSFISGLLYLNVELTGCEIVWNWTKWKVVGWGWLEGVEMYYCQLSSAVQCHITGAPCHVCSHQPADQPRLQSDCDSICELPPHGKWDVRSALSPAHYRQDVSWPRDKETSQWRAGWRLCFIMTINIVRARYVTLVTIWKPLCDRRWWLTSICYNFIIALSIVLLSTAL